MLFCQQGRLRLDACTSFPKLELAVRKILPLCSKRNLF
jgi:hypothetical protein